MRERARTFLLVLAVLCIIAFLTFGMKGSMKVDVELREYSVGLPASPWFTKTVEEGPGVRRENTRITLASWSWLVLVVGLLLLGIRNVLERESNSTPPGTGGSA
jgi:TRAP-type C4-dicarboxylate transport system permease small subunit